MEPRIAILIIINAFDNEELLSYKHFIQTCSSCIIYLSADSLKREICYKSLAQSLLYL